MNHTRPFLGFGLGLRPEHYKDILLTKPKVDWFEIITENYLVEGGKPLYYLDKIRVDYPIMMHGASLSLGSTDPLDYHHLANVKNLSERIEPLWISGQIAWTGINQYKMHELLPLPFTKEAIDHVVMQIQKIQEFLGRRILIENVSSYLTYEHSEMTEWEFISEIVTRADCFLLLDINNIYVNAINHEFSPLSYLNGVPGERIYQMQLAGLAYQGDPIIDTHETIISHEVWELYEASLQQFGAVSTMIERDLNIPPLSELLKELDNARRISKNILKNQRDIFAELV